ncbi:Flavohemoprotein [Porphyridium purpureum]|uniref:Flavohemoprotein n=1 Tax=Porphyridium purpureum TaxID=35688 RepID=A0A5J4YNA0_PORPP|nr:Flavohemoprotein [Porphyridium purpureum]|eukprot:POR2063..scf244_11
MESSEVKTLDAASAAIVAESAQFVATHGDVIAKRLYETLFERHPETLELFSMDFWPQVRLDEEEDGGIDELSDEEGQKLQHFKCAFDGCTKGFSIQPALMADSLQKYLVHVSDFGFDLIMNKIERICQKHVSRNIQPQHYPLIREGLLAGIEHALETEAGSGLPHEKNDILHAWGSAYDLLASMFIERERILRGDLAGKKNSWTNFESFLVIKVEETDKLWRFHLERVNKRLPPQVMPGQFVCVRVKTQHVGVIHRNFFLDPSPSKSVWIFSLQKTMPLDADSERDRSVMCKKFFAEALKVGNQVGLSMPLGGFLMKK